MLFNDGTIRKESNRMLYAEITQQTKTTTMIAKASPTPVKREISIFGYDSITFIGFIS